MQKDAKQDGAISPETQDVMRQLVTAIRAVKIYPPNNPVYSQSVKRTYDVLSRFLETAPDFNVGIQKTQFTCQNQTMGKDAQLNKAIAQDLFAKGIREIVFSAGVTHSELLHLCQALALSTEDMAMKSGISSILWEKDAEHIRVTEAGLDEVITTGGAGGWKDKTAVETSADNAEQAATKKSALSNRTLVMGDLMTDPSGFGAGMVEMAQKTRAQYESVEDRLYTLYQDAGRKIQETHAGESDAMFDGLAQSVLSLEKAYREGFIASKLYGELDAEIAGEESGFDLQLPSALHEIQTGRFSNSWTVQQIATLLKKTTTKPSAPSIPPPSPAEVKGEPVPADLRQIAKEMAVYSPAEMEELAAMSEAGMESDIIEAAVRTLIALLPLVKNPHLAAPGEKEVALFSGVVHQLEDMLHYLLKKKEYDRAGYIIDVLHRPVEPAFRPRMMEAIKKVASRSVILAAISDLRKHNKEAPEYQSAYAYVFTLDRATTEILLELLAEEKDRAARIFYLELAKEIAKNQIAILGERLSDGRWYFVRNIVNILSEIKSDQAIALLRKAADHDHIQIRQEVIKGLLAIGGKKASAVLAKFLRDKDNDIQLMAIRAYADFPEIGAEESKPLMAFLEDRPLTKKDQELTREAIKALGKTGGREAGEFLKRYSNFRWWKSRKLQEELRSAAQHSMEEIARRRQADAGPEQR